MAAILNGAGFFTEQSALRGGAKGQDEWALRALQDAFELGERPVVLEVAEAVETNLNEVSSF